MRLSLIATIVAALPLIGAAQSQPQSVPEGANRTDGAKPNQAQSQELRAIALELRAVRAEIANWRQQQAQQTARPEPPNWSNWMLVFVAAAAALVAYRTLKPIREQASATAKHLQRTERANEIAFESAKTQLALLRADQRPYIGVPDMGMMPNGVQPDRQMMFNVLIQNFGRTPAKNVRVKAGVIFRDPRTDWAFSASGIEVESVVVLMPTEKKELPIPSNERLTAIRLDAIIRVDVIPDVYGRIDYEDIRGEPYWTTFHGMYEPRSGAVVSAKTGNDCS